MGRKATIRDAVDMYNPPIRLLCKLGSIIVHADEGSGASAHEFDWVTLRSMLADPEVREWLDAMGKAGFLPVKR